LLWGATEVARAQPASFHRLGADVYPYGISPDGRVVVGTLNQEALAFRWTAETGVVALGPEIATGASSDGTVVIGFNALGGHSRAFRWTQATGVVYLGNLPGLPETDAYGVSADGAVVVGASWASTWQAYRWTVATGPVPLGGIAGFPQSAANDVSADGNTVVGMAFTGACCSPGHAFRWTALGGMEDLGILPGYSDFSEAIAISRDGRVVVGRSNSQGDNQAFRWTAQTGMVALGFLPRGPRDSIADAVSADGAVIVGSPASYGTNGFIWTATGGMRDIMDVLVGLGARSASAWDFLAPEGISADGTTIIGQGSICGQYAGWVARLSGPPLPTDCSESPANCDCSTTPPILNVGDFICYIARYAAGDPAANCDRSTVPPVLNVNDFLCFISEFVAGCP
jgi:probable HAF family extracellular repeat protein